MEREAIRAGERETETETEIQPEAMSFVSQ